MKELVNNILKRMLKGKDVTDDLVASEEVILAIKMNSKVLARLFFDKESKEFCLIYTSEFSSSGLRPFHLPLSSSNSSTIDIEKVYKSNKLWYPFALRVPNPERRDYENALVEAGLTGEEAPLEILGKLSNYSISKPWKFEVINGGVPKSA